MRSSSVTASADGRLAERTAAFLLERAVARWGRLWDQGARAGDRDPAPGPALDIFARRRVRGVPDLVARGLGAWARGERPVEVLECVPAPEEVLHLQARGRRCVSLLSDDRARAHGDPRHLDGLSFALHDLCHLEKFVDPEHHHGQVGFFRGVSRALASAPFRDLERGFDNRWRADRNYIIADMNGSAVFLFAVLKMRIKMAVRRYLGQATGELTDPSLAPAGPQARGGPLDPRERSAFESVLGVLLDGLGLPDDLREAGLYVSARRDHPTLARRLLVHFETTGSS